jgi:hypothetical protein
VDDYRAYLQSPQWATRRTRAFAAGKSTCQGCGRKAEHIHHRTYARLGRELDADLVAVCHDCHRDIHLHHAEHNDMSLWWATNAQLAARRALFGLPPIELPREQAARRRGRGRGKNKGQENSIQTAIRPVNSPQRVEIRKAACPKCGAGPGDPCRSRNGNVRPANHLQRVNARQRVT